MRKEYGDIVSYSALGKRIIILNSLDVIKEGLIGQADAFSGRAQLPVLKKYIIKGLGEFRIWISKFCLFDLIENFISFAL